MMAAYRNRVYGSGCPALIAKALSPRSGGPVIIMLCLFARLSRPANQ